MKVYIEWNGIIFKYRLWKEILLVIVLGLIVYTNLNKNKIIANKK